MELHLLHHPTTNRRTTDMPDPGPHSLSPAQEAMARALGPFDGARIDGGCTECNAYQTTRQASPGVWRITIHHDDWCPVLARHRRRTRRR
jgi:hypothetical protein